MYDKNDFHQIAGLVTLEIWGNSERWFFQIITVMCIKVYIFGMEMSQTIHFWYQISLKLPILWENDNKK